MEVLERQPLVQMELQPTRGARQAVLMEGIMEEDLQRVSHNLYVSRNASTPEAPGDEPHLRRRQRDAALAAWERANTLRDRNSATWQRTVDEDHAVIYQHTVARRPGARPAIPNNTRSTWLGGVNSHGKPRNIDQRLWHQGPSGTHCGSRGDQTSRGLSAIEFPGKV